AWRKPAAVLCRELGVQQAVRWLTRPFNAWIVSAAALWLWHIPAWFDAALKSEALHALQHTCFFLSALLFWWALFERRAAAARYGMSVFYLFTTGVHSSLLGALLTFSATPWYASYGELTQAWHLSALEDQQLGGLIMWIPGGLVYLGAVLALMAAWLQAGEREDRLSRGKLQDWARAEQARRRG